MIENSKIEELLISSQKTIGDALKQMDQIKRKLLIVIENDKFKGLLSIGDIQRAIIKGIDLSESISSIMRSIISIARENDSIEEIKQQMLESMTEYMPIISENNEIIRVLFWDDLFDGGHKKEKRKINLPVLLMAGGIGSRLRPLTNIFPKALIPIGEKTILEQIIDSFLEYQCENFYISVNYKSDMIKYYLNSLNNRNYNIHFIEEKEFLGTAGSIKLAKQYIESTFFVSNCDILIDDDYANILDFHKESKNEITIVAAIMQSSIPYGVLETNNEGQLIDIIEKPEYYYKINSGLYILEPNIFKDIPDNRVYHITDLIKLLMEQKRRVGVFPVSKESWTDMGNWNEFLKQARIK
jgi:dTDP-glucose pyrophosphorylase